MRDTEFLVCLMKPQNIIRGHVAAKKCVKNVILKFIHAVWMI